MPQERSGRITRWRTWAVASAVAAAAVAVSWTGITWPLDAWYYDRVLGTWRTPVSDQVVVVAVDEHSLEQIGQWPWPRSVHAALIDRLTRAGARGIAFDILFAEPGRDGGEGDAALARAITENGRTVLPVMPEQTRAGGLPIESMQVPAIGGAGLRLGHTDVELDRDDVARSLYLTAGLGDAHWPALGIALLQQEPQRLTEPLPGLRTPDAAQNDASAGSPYLWRRDHHVLLRYAGPPGSFAQLSYADVLHGRVDANLLRDRWIVVGVTATSLGRMFLTPMSSTVRMSGPEYQANVVEMLLQGNAIEPLSRTWQALLSALLALVTAVAAGATGNRRPWVTMLLATSLPLAVSLLLLRGAGLWFAPVPAIAVVLAGHLLWTLTHLKRWRAQASTDPLTRVANRRVFDQTLASEIAGARRAGEPLSLLLIDVDHFKRYNDSHGHHAGDLALMRIGYLLLKHARRSRDLAARFGGDEFALIMPATPASGAERVAQRLVDGARTLVTTDSGPPGFTVSVGVYTCFPDASTTAKSLLAGADGALYGAKERGRDGYCVVSIESAQDEAGTTDAA
jgi:diguanylate cyclase (GGDEF)-like protein